MLRAFPACVLTGALVSVVTCVRPLPSAPEDDFDAAAHVPEAGGSTAGAAGQTTNASGGGGHAAASVAAGGTGGTAGGVVGSDAAVPTCSDGIKNSDETGVDCGGHCGKCAAGNGCLVDGDCQFACRSDRTCGACIVAADCPGIESDCQHRTCTNGVCGSFREAGGTVLALQTTGDCKRRQCAPDGTVAAFNDDSDVPDDRNPCTYDICTTGTPSHTMVPAGSNCGGAKVCSAASQCVDCLSASSCPGIDSACGLRTCSADGVCGMSFAPSGTACGANLICDGAARCVEDVAR